MICYFCRGTGKDNGLSLFSEVLYNRRMQPEKPQISVVIPNFNGAPCLKGCIEALSRQTCAPFELIVVDNGSRDSSVEIVRRLAPESRILLRERNLGFAAAVNEGARTARGEWVAVLNNDTEADPEWLAECVAAIRRHPDASFLACCILDYRERSTVYSAGDCFLRAGLGYRRGQGLPFGSGYAAEIPVFSACGCAALYRREIFDAHLGYDERFFAYLEDVDLGLRMQAAGVEGYYVPAARVYHLGGATSGGEFSPLAARLRTRNSLLLLMKSLPMRILLRSFPRISVSQIVWAGRVVVHGRLISFLRGWAEAAILLPAMLRERRKFHPIWKASGERLWHSILESEALAHRDYAFPGEGKSRFLAWYFRLF